MCGDDIVPLLLRGLELLRLVVEAHEARCGDRLNGAFGGGDRAGERALDQILSSHELGVAAEQNVGTATCHVGGDRDHAQPSSLGNDLGFLLVELGVQHDVAYALALQDVGEQFGLLDAGGAYQHRLLHRVQAFDLVGDGEVFFLGRTVDDIRILDAQHLPVGGDDDDVELVDLVELGGFCLGGAGHSGELLVQAEVVLEGDGRERLIFLADLHAFLGFDGLVQAIRPAAAGHQAAGELVDDDDLAVLDHVLHIALVERVCLDGDLDVVLHVPVLGVGDVADAEDGFDLLPTLVGDGDGARLFVDDVIAGPGLGLERLDQLAQFQLGNNGIGDGVFVGGLIGRAGDDERGAGFVDEDRIDLVDDAVVVAALHGLAEFELHVVAQIVEAELVVRAVGDVRSIGFAALAVVEVMHDDADCETEEAIDLAHPFSIALGEIVVHRYDVDAVAGERVQIAGKCGDEGLAFAGLHLGDLAGVQCHAADHLNVEVAHADDAATGLTNDREGFGQKLIERGLLGSDDLFGIRQAFDGFGDAGFEFKSFGLQLGVGEGFCGLIETVDLSKHREHALDGAFVAGTEDFGENFVEQNGCPSCVGARWRHRRRGSQPRVYVKRIGRTGVVTWTKRAGGRTLDAETGDGLELHGVCGGRAHRPDGAVQRERSDGKIERKGVAAIGVELR